MWNLVPYPRFLQISKNWCLVQSSQCLILCPLPSWNDSIPDIILTLSHSLFHRKPNHTHDCKILGRDHVRHHTVLPCCSSPVHILPYLLKALLEWPVICYCPNQDIKNWKKMLLIIYWNDKFQPGLCERKQERGFSTNIRPFLAVN